MTVRVVFNLYPFSDTLYLPSANIVQADRDGQLLHLLQKATPATLSPYGLSPTPAEERLLGIVEALSAKALEQKFKPPKAKAPTPLAALLADKTTRPSVEAYVFGQLDAFLGLLHQQRLPLTLDAERRSLAKDVQVHCAPNPLVPHLFFKKTAEGIEYALQLQHGEQRWRLRDFQVLPLTNLEPAWVLVDYGLYRVPGINGNMLRPFLQKDSVLVPARSEREYFRKVIAKSIRRSQVEAEGFRVEKTEALRHTRLELVENVLEKNWLLKPFFEYDGSTFYHGERRDRVTALDIPEEGQPGDITVHLICRDVAKEAQHIDFLKNTGLMEDNRAFRLPEPPGDAGGNLYALVAWLAEQRDTLERAGIRVEPPQVEGRAIALHAHGLQLRTALVGDWFDVQGVLNVGPHQFPFQRLLPNLRRRDPYFPLPDGSFFLIPPEWFARYGELAGALQEKGPALRLPKSLYTILPDAEAEQPAPELPVVDPETIDYQPSENLKAALRPYQLQGVKWLLGHYRNGLGAYLADDMGLGKTLQTIALLLHAKENAAGPGHDGAPASPAGQLDLFRQYQAAQKPLNALVILPASLVFNWQKELSRFAPTLFSYAHIGPKRLRDIRALLSHDVVLTTYHTARQDLDLLDKTTWHFIVLDESQQIKNRDSELSKVVRSLQGRCKISLSGTPIENALSDLWTQMEFLNPATLGPYRQFREQFQLPIEKQRDEQAKARLYQRVRPFFLRRSKEEVAPELPPLSTQLFYSEMSPAQKKHYERLKSAMRNQILSLFDAPQTRLQALQALTRLRQIANHPVLADPDYTGDSAKLDDVLAQWDVVRRAGHKVLFFSSYEQHLLLYRRAFEAQGTPFAWLSGETPSAQRAREVARFQQEPEVQAFLMTLGAGGVGLNLTAADYVFLLDPWWNPAKEDQAIARAHRIGQERPVTALRFISRDSIEEKILLLQAQKKQLGEGLFDAEGQGFPALDRADMELLLG
jgi:non-specific serine/threonine protein kinase